MIAVQRNNHGSNHRKSTLDWQNHAPNDNSIRFRCSCGNSKLSPRFDFNPVVSIISFVLIVGFVTFCSIYATDSKAVFASAKTWITDKFTWLYIGSQDLWIVFVLVIYCSKYGSMKLGKDSDEPEFNDATWFSMLFACGIGVGLFFYGVAEPIYHYTGKNRFTADVYRSDNEVAQWAMNLTLYHWGLHAWIVYVVVGLTLSIMCYRKGLRMTMKSCFYPLVGDRIFGWVGDFIDILSIIATLFGVCTSLGLGVIQLNSGLKYVFGSVNETIENQKILIWIITFMATMSTVSGIGLGIRRLSEVCFAIGVFLMVAVLFLDDTWFLLNLFTQSFGSYVQWIIQLGFHCDAFEMVAPSYGGKADGDWSDRNRHFEDTTSDGPANWMDGWTVFYWGWWISWSPFVGMFIAQISKGRTIREFINGTMSAPMLYGVLWFSIFGGTAILEERQAASLHYKLCCPNWNTSIAELYNVNDSLIVNADTNTDSTSWGAYVCAEGKCSDCSKYWIKNYTSNDTLQHDLKSFIGFLEDRRFRFGQYSYDERKVRLSCLGTTQMWFALMNTYGDLGRFLNVISMIGLTLYFATSSDSGSLVIDILAANGVPEPPRLQRLFWALCEGATATALLHAGGNDALTALQTVSIITGLPYTIILCLLCTCLWTILGMEFGDIDPYGPNFNFLIVDPFSTIQPRLWTGIILNIFITPYKVYIVMSGLGSGVGNSITMAVISGISWSLWIILLFFEIEAIKIDGIYAIAWLCYLVFATTLTLVRHKCRTHYRIYGNGLEDAFVCLIFYPVAITQLELTMLKGIVPLMPRSRSKVTIVTNESAVLPKDDVSYEKDCPIKEIENPDSV